MRRYRPRASREARGYGRSHQILRDRLTPYVLSGSVRCSRCGEVIAPADEWHLDHADDRRGYLGAAHAKCNLKAAGLKAHGLRLAVSRRW